MNFNVKSEIIFPNHTRRYDVTILKGGNMDIYTDIPLVDQNNRMIFQQGQTLQISYYFGQFAYVFDVVFQETIKEIQKKVELNREYEVEVEMYHFLIRGVEIEKNLRKEQRRNVSYEAALLTAEGIDHVKIVDISEGGAKIETKKIIQGNYIDLFFEEDEKKFAFQGKAVWGKQEGSVYYYGIKFLREE